MRTIGKLFVLASLASLLACSSTSPCEDGTVFLTIDLATAPASVDSLLVSVTVNGSAPKTNTVPRRAGSTKESITIAFSAGYPAGGTVTVDASGLAAGAVVTSGATTFTAASGCTVASLILGSGVPGGADAGTDGPSPGGAEAGAPDVEAGVPSCTPGALRCAERVLSTCTPAGVWAETEECAFKCETAACVGECSPGSSRCGAAGAQTCSATGMWSQATACPAGCDAENRACAAPCTAAETRCVGNLLQTCGASGWDAGTECPFVCKANACGGECKPGTSACDGNGVKVCTPEGTWGATTACEFICDKGACTGICKPGDKRCNGGAVETCDATAAWVETTKCEFSCANNACAPKQPGKPGVPPTVLSITPADGTKVREQDTITVVFSEGMNTASVEAAWKPASVGAPKPTFMWSGDKSVVTVDPKFTYPAGTDTSLPRGSYTFTIGTDAKDENGEALAAPVPRTYPLAFRRITTRLPFAQRDAASAYASGNIGGGDTSIGTWAMVGWDSGDTGRTDTFLTFFVDPIPAGISIEKATLFTESEVVYGAPTGFTTLRIADTVFPLPLSASAYTLSFTKFGAGIPATTLFTVGGKGAFDVTAQIVSDYTLRASRMNRSQFRLTFDGSGPADKTVRNAIRLLRTATFVDVVGLIE